MGAFLLFVVLTIGFIYTSRDLEARYKQKKSTNWESYSHMALWGFVFWGLGGVIVSIFWLLLAIVSYIITFIGCFFSETFIVEWHSKFHDWTMVETSVPLCISLIMGAVFAWGVTEDRARKTKEDPQARLNVIQKIAASDNIQLLLIESSRKQLRVMLTLKSRKVYIGFIKQFAHEQVVPGDEDIVVIPLISGYRDKDSLTFHESHSYVTFYDENGIGPDTQPLSLDDFRVVIPREQIESVSLFDAKTYVAFQTQPCDGAARLAVGPVKPG
ncbi:hypothetical protein AAW03_15855 [Aeromonas dhakensis]|nr:hypothetical protein AAW03_15855 [Aeromonas dhakensis]